MSYVPPTHLAVVLSSKAATNRDVAFAVEALKLQLEDVAAVWGYAPPGVQMYTPETFVPKSDGMLMVILDDDGNDDALGFHNPLGAVIDVRQSPILSEVVSHEGIEMFLNWNLDRWEGPDWSGLYHAVEGCDAVQRRGYDIIVSMFGEERRVRVADFLYPAWFGLHNKSDEDDDRMDYSGAVDVRFEVDYGGYSIVKDEKGNVSFFSSGTGARLDARKLSQRSRLWRFVTGGGR